MTAFHKVLRALSVAALALFTSAALAEDAPSLRIVWPVDGMTVPLGSDIEGVIGVVVESNFRLAPAGSCGDDPRCGHVHMRIDPQSDDCNTAAATG